MNTLSTIAGRLLSWLRSMVALLLAPAMLVSCTQVEPQGEPVIRINTGGLIGEAGVFLAADNGYFEQEGVKVRFVTAAANASTDSLAQLATGDLDIALFGPTAAMFNAIDRGFDVVGIMPLNVLTPGDNSRGLVVRQELIDSGRYRDAGDLRGLKVGTLTTGGVGHFFVLEALHKGKVRPDEIELSTLPMPDSIIALSTGSLDASFLVEPFISAIRERKAGELAISSADTSTGVPTAVVFVSTDFARRHRALVERFTVALLKGQRDYADAVASGRGRDKLLRSLQRHTATKEMARLEKLALPHVDPDGGYDPEGLMRLQRFFIESGAMRHAIAPDRVFDDRYVQHARQVLAARAAETAGAPAR